MTERISTLVAALWAPFGEPDSRTWWPALLLSLAVAWGVTGSLRAALGLELWKTRSSQLDLQILAARRLLSLLLPIASGSLSMSIALTVARALDDSLGAPQLPEPPLWLLSLGYTAVLFVAWDASRWLLHYLSHRVPVLWELHQVHHSASVLTPLTFHRVHPIESLLYELRGALVSGTLAALAFWLWRGAAVEITVFGGNIAGIVLNTATGNLRHSHIWLRFPVAIERLLLSPAQHQLHHGIAPEHQGCNLGTWLALWDRIAGTWRPSPALPCPIGLPAHERNHGDDLLSALLGPLRAAAALLGTRGAKAALLTLVLPLSARAEGPESAEEEPPPYEVVVIGPRALPRVAGSAHEITEEELTRWGYDDIHRVLTKVPGVYVRGEDGFGLRPNIGMRGGSSDRSAKIALMQDGVPISPAPYAAPAAYYFPLSSRLVGIEIFKGAASIRHGPQTIGGAVNLLTRQAPRDGAEGLLDLGVGLRSTAEMHGFVGTGGARRGWIAEAAHLSTRGFKQLDTGGPTGFSRQDVSLSAFVATPDRGEVEQTLTLTLGYGREVSHESYLGLSAGDLEETPYRRYAASALDLMRWDHTEERLRWSISAGRRLEIETTAYHNWLARAWTKLNRFAGGPDLHDLLLFGSAGQSEVYLAVLRGEEDSTSPDQELMIGTNDRTFHSGGLSSVATLSHPGQRISSTLELGARLHFDDVVRIHTEDPYAMTDGTPVRTDGERLTTLDAHTTARAISLYAAEDAKLGPLHLLPGLRTEIIRTAAGTTAEGPSDPIDRAILLPGVGLYADILPWIDALLGLHRGFSPVAPGEPEDIRPESAINAEAGLRAAGGQSRAEIIGFFSEYDNLTGQCTLSGGCLDDQLDQQFNGGEARVAGIEALGEHLVLLPHRLSIGATASWTYTSAVFRTGFVSAFPQWGTVVAGDGLPYVPAHQGTASLVADIDRRANFALSATGRSAMRDVAGSGPLGPSSSEPGRVPGALQLDLAASLWPTDRIRIHASATNLTNTVVLESWRPFGARPASPLQLSLGVAVGQPRLP